MSGPVNLSLGSSRPRLPPPSTSRGSSSIPLSPLTLLVGSSPPSPSLPLPPPYSRFLSLSLFFGCLLLVGCYIGRLDGVSKRLAVPLAC